MSKAKNNEIYDISSDLNNLQIESNKLEQEENQKSKQSKDSVEEVKKQLLMTLQYKTLCNKLQKATESSLKEFIDKKEKEIDQFLIVTQLGLKKESDTQRAAFQEQLAAKRAELIKEKDAEVQKVLDQRIAEVKKIIAPLKGVNVMIDAKDIEHQQTVKANAILVDLKKKIDIQLKDTNNNLKEKYQKLFDENEKEIYDLINTRKTLVEGKKEELLSKLLKAYEESDKTSLDLA
ncbi:MAG: hypothetical protein K0R02_515 [Rickettsiaceae bacterium]|jgi:hypothetical protein|nr:hypothetical protein [Rickettsiaceae bacterium]